MLGLLCGPVVPIPHFPMQKVQIRIMVGVLRFHILQPNKIILIYVYCGSDHELLIAKFKLKLKKVGETTRPFRYDLNQIPYDYTMEVTNRFKGLDLIDRVPEELWMEVYNTV